MNTRVETLKPEVKKAWVEALRSGKYKQGTGKLNRNNSFCCLGVLCDISELEEWKLPGSRSISPTLYSRKNYSSYGDNVYFAYPPNSVWEWALQPHFSLNDMISCLYDRDHFQVSLSGLNDSGEFTFDQIADIIEYFF